MMDECEDNYYVRWMYTRMWSCEAVIDGCDNARIVSSRMDTSKDG